MTLALPNADAITKAADIASFDTQSEIPYSPAKEKEVYCVNVGRLGPLHREREKR